MIPALREKFNSEFTEEKYKAFLDDLDRHHPGAIVFRVAETPVFVPKAFTGQMVDACESIVDFILRPDFCKLTDRAIPASENVPGESGLPEFMCFDFGVCEDGKGNLQPQLIEMQAFPTLFGFQVLQPEILEKHFDIPRGFTNYMDGLDKESYIDLLRKIIVGDHDPENVILLEIKPHEQKTRVDFYCTRDYLGIPIVCLTELKEKDGRLFYQKDGKDVPVKRIYNRIIFDELHHVKDKLGDVVDITKPLEVEWVPHPNWFYRVSKFTVPFIKHPCVPETHFLNEVKQLPGNLEDFVLKPLFSFAGQGVIIDLTQADIEKVPDPENWILQKKVKYAEVIKTPNTPAKAEIRIFYFWEKSMPRPIPVNNLARLSKGKMIGVRYNMDKDWVGGSTCYFEKKDGEH